jgi:hypothetical protein
MASAILRTIRPENYTVIDVRALEFLGVSKTDGSVNDVGSENSEPLIPEILSRSALEDETSSKFR